MFLILVSLITGFIGMVIGGTLLGIVGFLSPTIFIIQKIYIKLESLSETDLSKTDISIEGSKSGRNKESSNENETVLGHCEVCPACKTRNNEIEQYCIGCGLKLID